MKLVQNEKGEFILVPYTPEELAAMQPTQYQLDCEVWGDMEFEWKIIAPISLLDPINPENDLFHKFNNYLMAQGLPSENVGPNKVIWCREIQSQHVDYIQAMHAKGVVIEKRP